MKIEDLFNEEIETVDESTLEILDEIDLSLAGGCCGYGCTGNV